jgi:hypothetical protein
MPIFIVRLQSPATGERATAQNSQSMRSSPPLRDFVKVDQQVRRDVRYQTFQLER